MKPNEKLVSNVEIALSENEEMQQLIKSRISHYQNLTEEMYEGLRAGNPNAVHCIASCSLVLSELKIIKDNLECGHAALCDLLVQSGVKE